MLLRNKEDSKNKSKMFGMLRLMKENAVKRRNENKDRGRKSSNTEYDKADIAIHVEQRTRCLMAERRSRHRVREREGSKH